MYTNEQWIFTFGADQPQAGTCIRLYGTEDETREKMFELFGDKWAFQYRADVWEAYRASVIRSNGRIRGECEISVQEALKRGQEAEDDKRQGVICT